MKLNKKSFAALLGLCTIFAPLLAGAQSVPLNQSTGSVLQLMCYDFKTNLKSGDKGEAVRRLQLFLEDQGAQIPSTEFGSFGAMTTAAVISFQQKYAAAILTPANLTAGTGFVGKGTRAKLNSIYGCNGTFSNTGSLSLNLGISNLSIDTSGVNATFCNKSTNDVPAFPVRLRLNGVIRDFDIVGAQLAGACDTESFGYADWGLAYNSSSSYAVVAAVDPSGIYKNTLVNIVPYGVASTTLSIPAIAGAHLSVRHVELKATGFQGTFCNLGTVTLTSFPVQVTMNNSTTTNFDVPGAYQPGQCSVITWGYDKWGLTYTPGAQYTASVTVDASNTYKGVNEFDNSAVIVGTP